ncbi:MAG: transposase [Firmicutes bacterium]|nr:transposase [Bacillota bacterium]MCL5065967.1 transposase [Bacillota bacterium]
MSEADTSQTCPHCGHPTKMGGRTYHCRACDYRVHRDRVGAVNILNTGMHSEEIRPGGVFGASTDRVSPSRPSQDGVKAQPI